MGILELHFHDSEFSWSMNPGTDEERSFSLGSGGESATPNSSGTSGGRPERPAIGPKLRSLAIMALVVGAGIAYNKMQSRRREAAERESGGRLAGLRSRSSLRHLAR